MNVYTQLILANRAWVAEKRQDDPDYFARHAGPEAPVFMWIGSSDSRVVPERITRSPPGSLYIHRNLGNVVSSDDASMMAAVEHAIFDLGVRHIILCGHYACTSLAAALAGKDEGPTGAWLAPARAVYAAHRQEIDGAGDTDARLARFVELNVRAQLLRLAATTSVQAAFAQGMPLGLHGWVYDLRDGLIKPLLELDGSSNLGEVPSPAPVLAKLG